MSRGAVTRILARTQAGDAEAARELLPLVYQELRTLATRRLARETAGQTLQPTALVHEAYLRLVDGDEQQTWDGRRHFFAAAAEAMRRILIDNARRKHAEKHGGGLKRVDLEQALERPYRQATSDENLLDLDAALDRLAGQDAEAAQLVKLRFYTGLTIPQAAELLGMSSRKADLVWSFARAWLRRELSDD